MLLLFIQLPEIDLHKYYTPLESESVSEDESGRRPVLINLKNCSFCHKMFPQNDDDYDDENDGNMQNFFLQSVSGQIKKVSNIHR